MLSENGMEIPGLRKPCLCQYASVTARKVFL